MKSTVLLLAALFAVGLVCRSQTTWSDYRYITAGLKDDLDKGKKPESQGYYLARIGNMVTVPGDQGNKRSFQLYSFKNGESFRGHAIYCYETANRGFYFYLCIPTANAPAEIWDKYAYDLSRLDREWHYLISLAFSQITAKKY
jgi:hypothetical protein